MRCGICGGEAKTVFRHKVRVKYQAEYALCPTCDYYFVVKPTWLAEAYTKPINITDTGYVTRNIFLSRKTLILFSIIFGLNGVRDKTFLDYAAGYGILVRLMRDYGLNFLWDDPYTPNLFAKGFERTTANLEKVSAMTCFECFEHFEEPALELNKMLFISDTVFFSTKLRPVGSVPAEDWEYYGFDHGQHISFYSVKTLSRLAMMHGLHLYTDGDNLHLMTKVKLSRSVMGLTNLLTKIQSDLFLRKLLSSKTTDDGRSLAAISATDIIT